MTYQMFVFRSVGKNNRTAVMRGWCLVKALRACETGSRRIISPRIESKRRNNPTPGNAICAKITALTSNTPDASVCRHRRATVEWTLGWRCATGPPRARDADAVMEMRCWSLARDADAAGSAACSGLSRADWADWAVLGGAGAPLCAQTGFCFCSPYQSQLSIGAQ